MGADVRHSIPDPVQEQVVDLALNELELSPRELAIHFTDVKKYFVSETSVYRLLKSYDLITSPAYVVVKAADEFRDKTTRLNQMLLSGMLRIPFRAAGRPTSPISRCLDGAGSICPRCWTTSRVTSWAGRVPLKPGVIHLLDALHVKGLPMAVATSTKRSKAVALLQRAGILGRFTLLVCGDEVARGKPAPDVYLAAVGGLGQQPDACVAFEDSSNGVRAAVSAGLVTVQVPDLLAPPAEIVALGHVIAPDLLTGARQVGCL